MRNFLPRFRFIAGFLFASLIFTVGAVAVNVNNTPQGGYLLCANTKTKAVTFPGTLKCPTGTQEILIPGSNNVNSMDSENTSDNSTSQQNTSKTGKGSPNCTLNYLQANPGELNSILNQCSSTQINTLINQITNTQNDLQLAIKKEQDKLVELQKIASDKANKAKAAATKPTPKPSQSGSAASAIDAANAATDAANAAAQTSDAATAAAQDAQAEVAAQSAKIAALTANMKSQITLLSNLVVVIQKKVKG